MPVFLGFQLIAGVVRFVLRRVSSVRSSGSAARCHGCRVQGGRIWRRTTSHGACVPGLCRDGGISLKVNSSNVDNHFWRHINFEIARGFSNTRAKDAPAETSSSPDAGVVIARHSHGEPPRSAPTSLRVFLGLAAQEDPCPRRWPAGGNENNARTYIILSLMVETPV